MHCRNSSLIRIFLQVVATLAAVLFVLLLGLYTAKAALYPKKVMKVHFPLATCAVLCYELLCCAVPCCGLFFCAVLCCAVLCCAVLCCAVLCCAVLCCAVLCCAFFPGLPWRCCRHDNIVMLCCLSSAAQHHLRSPVLTSCWLTPDCSPFTCVLPVQEWQCPMRSNSFSIPFMILMLFAYIIDGQFNHSHKFAQVRH